MIEEIKMASSSTHQIFLSFLLLLLISSITRSCCCYGHHSGGVQSYYHKHATAGAALFIFGDSLYDPGNNNYINTTASFRANFTPYGESFFKYNPTGRFSDGRLICDFIAEYAKLPLIPAYSKPDVHQYIHGVNFASGGAGSLVETNRGFVIDLKTQRRSFKKVVKKLKSELGDAEAKKLLRRAIYLFSIGGNDYISPLLNNLTILQQYSRTQYVDIVIGNFTSVIKGVYKKGGRKFGFISMPPLGCIPSMKASNPERGEGEEGDCYKEATVLTKLHNKALPKVLRKLESQLKGFKYSFTDLYSTLSDQMNNPSKYGFKEGEIACCGSGPYRGIYSCGGKRGVEEYELCSDPTDYVFFDSSHPSEKAYQQFAELMWNKTPSVASLYNLKALFEDHTSV